MDLPLPRPRLHRPAPGRRRRPTCPAPTASPEAAPIATEVPRGRVRRPASPSDDQGSGAGLHGSGSGASRPGHASDDGAGVVGSGAGASSSVHVSAHGSELGGSGSASTYSSAGASAEGQSVHPDEDGEARSAQGSSADQGSAARAGAASRSSSGVDGSSPSSGDRSQGPLTGGRAREARGSAWRHAEAAAVSERTSDKG